MRFVYPPSGHQTAESQTFFIGASSPGSTLSCNGEPVPVSPEGFVSHVVSLTYGENPFVWTENGNLTQTHTIQRMPTQPLGLLAVPDSLWTLPGESIRLTCIAPQGARVWVQIGPIQVSMTESSANPRNQSSIFGAHHQVEAPYDPSARQFTAQVTLPNTMTTGQPYDITYHAVFDEIESIQPGGDWTILCPQQPKWGTVSHPDSVCRVFPVDGQRLTPLMAGVRLAITGKRQNWLRFAHSATGTAWLCETDLILDHTAPNAAIACQPLDFIRVEPSETGIRVVLPLPHPVPFHVETDVTRVQIQLDQTPTRCDVIRWVPGVQAAGLADVHVRPLNESTTVIDLALQTTLLGVSWQHKSGQWILDIRTAQAQRLQPWIVAIDPGHGGDESGTCAPEGSLEKDLNLAMAHRLYDLLQNSADFQPMLIRNSDEALTLPQRTQMARDSKASLLISLHHNALPDGRNPLAECGVSSYYYHSFAQPLAQTLQAALVSGTDFADYGLLWDNLHMCREMAMPSVLLELGFTTHPQDATLILDPDHQHRVAQAIAVGLQQYVDAFKSA